MKKIIFLALPVIMLLWAFSTNEKIIVSGTISGEAGQAVAYASVQEVGSTAQVSADGYGYYSITVKGKDAVLAFSAVGYQTKAREHITAIFEQYYKPLGYKVICNFTQP